MTKANVSAGVRGQLSVAPGEDGAAVLWLQDQTVAVFGSFEIHLNRAEVEELIADLQTVLAAATACAKCGKPMAEHEFADCPIGF